MKKRKVGLVVLLTVMCLCSCETKPSAPETNTEIVAQEKSLSDEILRSIEGEYEKEAKKDENTTTVGMINLAYGFADKWDAVSAEYYDKILAAAGDENGELREKLDKMKVSYEEYTQNNLDVQAEIYNLKYPNGSVIGPLCATEYYNLKKEYALELVDIYEKLIFDME